MAKGKYSHPIGSHLGVYDEVQLISQAREKSQVFKDKIAKIRILNTSMERSQNQKIHPKFIPGVVGHFDFETYRNLFVQYKMLYTRLLRFVMYMIYMIFIYW